LSAVVAPSQSLFYLYGVLAPESLGAALVRTGKVPGIDDDEPLFPVEAAGLLAAVSRVPATDFEEEPLNALVNDLSRLTPYAVRHEEVIRALARSALVPMTFGAVYRSAYGVVRMLEERAGDLRSLLERLDGREEWGLKVFAHLPRLQAVAEQESDQLRDLARQAAAARPGRAYLLAKQRERLRGQESSRAAAGMLRETMERLTALAVDAVQEDTGPAQPGMEQLLLKAAFLVERAGAETFSRVARDLDRSNAPRGLRLELSGPWAPYSFVRERRDHRG
jgi:hypothetical protein